LTGADAPTFFDILTVLAFAHFLDRRVDLAVIETGLGGRLDSTNVITPEVVGITSLSLDHQDLLGSTIEHIAQEKAGVFKRRIPIVTVNQDPGALGVLQRQALAVDAPLTVVGRDCHYSYRCEMSREEGPHGRIWLTTETSAFENVRVPLHGQHQALNCALALALLDRLKGRGFTVHEGKTLQGLRSVKLPGRLEMIGGDPRIVLDGAHNAASMRALIQTLALHVPADSVVTIFGCNRDKDIEGMLRELQYGADKVVFTRNESPRSMCPYELAQRYEEIGRKMCQVADTLEQALVNARACTGGKDLICIAGGFGMVGQAKRLLSNGPAGKSRITPIP
jgi:dihydrofolate synthase/folylpolyglutamate synthase